MDQTINKKAKRYVIVGCGGSGKSTLARKIAEIEGLPYVNTDALYWREDWKLRTDAEVLTSLPLDDEAWVLDGNFVDAVDQVWARADRVIWLNYSKPAIFVSLLRRNLLWGLGWSTDWNGKRMPLAVAMSGVRHFFRQYPRIQRTFPEFLRSLPEGKVLVLSSRVQSREWLEHFSTARG